MHRLPGDLGHIEPSLPLLQRTHSLRLSRMALWGWTNPKRWPDLLGFSRFGVAGMALGWVCNSDYIGRILKSDQTGRSFRVLPYRRPHGDRRVSVLSELN